MTGQGDLMRRAAEASNGEGEVERAVLALLDAEPELYPSQVAARLGDDASPDGLRPLLGRLLAERRVARLWHRYLLADAVDAVRTRWLSTIDAHCDRLRGDGGDPGTCARARHLVEGWDGWQFADGEAS
jgi:hypothetical protein